ncbi:putative BAH domain, transcription elongation factor S-II, central domain-containing protein [Dioscorea sansibarensis]
MMKRRFSDDEYDGGASSGDRKEEGKQENSRENGEEFEASGEGAANDGLEVEEAAKPIGMPVRVSGKGRNRKLHFESFEYYGNVYKLNDNVLLSPENVKEKPYIAIIKDITQDVNGSVMVTGQWFYRPEEAAKEGGGTWQGRDTRELYFSFHIDEFPAESVMHKCVIHFIPMHKQLPIRTEYPGFIVQKFYDILQRKLWKLNEYDLEDDVKREITRRVNETRKRLGELPDIVENAPASMNDELKGKCQIRSPATPPSALRGGMTVTSSHAVKVDSPRASISDVSGYLNILVKFKAKTGDTYRDKWLAKLLQGIEPSCNLKEYQSAGKSTNENGNGFGRICWPDTAVSAIVALEKASFDAFYSDFHKYNQKMRQLDFNLKNKGVLARRLLNKELDPVVIINMLPNELKLAFQDGLTAEEKTSKEPEVSKKMQMTDARCSRCMEKKVGVVGIIQTAGHLDRYQLECNGCGHTWYAPRDAVPFLTTDSPTNTAKPN